MGKSKNNTSIACYNAIYEYRKKGRRYLSQKTANLLKMMKRPIHKNT